MILVISCVFPPEPVVSARLSITIAKALSEEHDVTVLSPLPTRPNGSIYSKPDFKGEKFSHITTDTYVCPVSNFTGRLRESISFGRCTAKYIRDHHKDISVIYANTWPLFGQYFVVKEAECWGIPVVLHIQDIYPESMLKRLGVVGRIIAPPLLWLDKITMRKSTAILAISGNMKSYICRTRNIGEDKVLVVRNWQDDSLFPEMHTQNDRFTFMFVGSISPAAGVMLLLKSFVKASISNSRLVIAGAGSDRDACEAYARRHPDADIRFMSVTPIEVAKVQSSANVLLLPLRKGVGHTASPSKMPAYMFSAKPILACVDKGSDVDMIINECKCGWVCNPEDEGRLSEMMVNISRTLPQELERIGANARKYALEHFTCENNLNLIVEKIKSLANADKGNK